MSISNHKTQEKQEGKERVMSERRQDNIVFQFICNQSNDYK